MRPSFIFGAFLAAFIFLATAAASVPLAIAAIYGTFAGLFGIGLFSPMRTGFGYVSSRPLWGGFGPHLGLARVATPLPGRSRPVPVSSGPHPVAPPPRAYTTAYGSGTRTHILPSLPRGVPVARTTVMFRRG